MNERRLTRIVYNKQKRLKLPKCWHYKVMNDLEMVNIKLNEDETKISNKGTMKICHLEKHNY